MPTAQNWNGNPVCTPADIRRHLRGIEISSDWTMEDSSPEMQRLCRQATRRAVVYCQRIFEATDYVKERYHGTGRRGYIELRNYPVLSFTKLTAWDYFRKNNKEFVASEENETFVLEREYGEIQIIPSIMDWLISFAGPEFDEGFLNMGLAQASWNVEVTYRAGFEVYPEDLIDAVSMLGANLLLSEISAAKSNGVSSFSADGVSVSFGNGPFSTRMDYLSKQSKEILNTYKRRLVGGM